MKERVTKLSDIGTLFNASGELNFVQSLAEYETSMLVWKKNPDKSLALKHIEAVHEIIRDMPESGFSAENIKIQIMPYAEKNGKGDVLWPMRVALSGQDKSPDPFVCTYILGKYETLKRLEIAKEKLS